MSQTLPHPTLIQVSSGYVEMFRKKIFKMKFMKRVYPNMMPGDYEA
jgi:hypothetical protein